LYTDRSQARHAIIGTAKSEYQYYEFLAVDKPLTSNEMQQLRAFSTRARITPTSFINEYNWGDFRGDVNRFMTKYFDAFVYFANWGTHELRFRLPKASLDVSPAKRYCPCDYAHLRTAGEHIILKFLSEDEEGGWVEDEGWMSSLAPLRADLMAGDLRCLYLGWLQCVGCNEVQEEEVEPPVPPGLRELTAPLRALADFLRVDETLIEVAAEVSPPLAAERDSAEELRAWIQTLPGPDKDSLLYRLAQESPMAVQREILRRFREARRPQPPVPETGGRTVGELLGIWNRQTQEKQRRAAEKKAREEARRKKEAAAARQAYLDGLAQRAPQAWQQVGALIQTRQPKKYDEAAQLLRDLCDLADRQGKTAETRARLQALRDAHANKPSLLRRLDEAGLSS
jgi:hypothetical protein